MKTRSKLQDSGNMSEQVLATLRRIIQCTELHSRALVKRYGLTSPQLIVLHEIAARGQATAAEIASAVSLSQPTITGIIERLEKRDLISRRRSSNDRRRILLQPTHESAELLAEAPPLMQESFVTAFEGLHNWEKSMILASLQRLAALMEEQHLHAAPYLTTDAPNPPEETPDFGAAEH